MKQVSILATGDKLRRSGHEPELKLRDLLVTDNFTVRQAQVAKDLKTDVLASLAAGDQLVFVLGGTGIGDGQTTPETIASLALYEIPGVGERMRAESHKYSDKAFISRSGAWRTETAIIVAMPSGHSAIDEHFAILKPMLGPLLHAISGACGSRGGKTGQVHERI